MTKENKDLEIKVKEALENIVEYVEALEGIDDEQAKKMSERCEKLAEKVQNNELSIPEAIDEAVKQPPSEEASVVDEFKKFSVEQCIRKVSQINEDENKDREREVKNTNKNMVLSVIAYYKKIIDMRDDLIKLMQECPMSEKQLSFFMKVIHEYESSIEKLIIMPEETFEFVSYKDICEKMGWKEYSSGDVHKESFLNITENNIGAFTRRT